MDTAAAAVVMAQVERVLVMTSMTVLSHMRGLLDPQSTERGPVKNIYTRAGHNPCQTNHGKEVTAHKTM